ncbi:hypothetical protein C0J52_18074 [Blattella germanica]|nr:hypothetical protein C0J52_18074 [Blattella germanica]
MEKGTIFCRQFFSQINRHTVTALTAYSGRCLSESGGRSAECREEAIHSRLGILEEQLNDQTDNSELRMKGHVVYTLLAALFLVADVRRSFVDPAPVDNDRVSRFRFTALLTLPDEQNSSILPTFDNDFFTRKLSLLGSKLHPIDLVASIPHKVHYKTPVGINETVYNLKHWCCIRAVGTRIDCLKCSVEVTKLNILVMICGEVQNGFPGLILTYNARDALKYQRLPNTDESMTHDKGSNLISRSALLHWEYEFPQYASSSRYPPLKRNN